MQTSWLTVNLTTSKGSINSAVRLRRALPWLVFGLGFLFSTGIGAAITGLSGGNRWGFDVERQGKLGLNVLAVPQDVYASEDYWILLLLCSVAPLVAATVAFSLGITVKQSNSRRSAAHGLLWPARLAFSICALWLIFRVTNSLPSPIETIKNAWTGDLVEHYRVRAMVMDSLSGVELGFGYIGMLSLLNIPIYYALFSTPSTKCWLEVLCWFLLYCLVAVILVQKLLVSFAILLIVLSLLASGYGRQYWKRIVFLGILFVAVIHWAMTLLLPEWSIEATADHILWRSADAYPFAMSIEQKHPFSLGQFLVGSVLGRPAFLGDAVAPNIDVYNRMYPESVGAVALAAPVWSYCDVGIKGSLLSLGIIALFCWLCSSIAANSAKTPLRWGLFMSSLMAIYCLTQIPVVGVLFWSYGIVYGATMLMAVDSIAQGMRFLRGKPVGHS